MCLYCCHLEGDCMRLDRFLAEKNIGTRSQVKAYLKQGFVQVNGQIVKKPETQIREGIDEIFFQDKKLSYQSYEYYMLNKPQGVLSATKDLHAPTVLDLLPQDHRKDTFPVGRLDKDTEGMMILTNDGELAHRLLSPRHHVSKTYLCRIEHALTKQDILQMEQGIDLGEDGRTLPAKVFPYPEIPQPGCWITLTIHEGKFHQVKRMLEAVGNKVLYLKRIRFGALTLDRKLDAGECRPLTIEEITLLKHSEEIEAQKRRMIQDKKAVIFDLDGTLVDSMWIWGDIDREYLGRHGIGLENHRALQREIEGMSFHETAVYFKEHFPIEDSIEKMKSDWNQMAWDKYEREVPLKPGIPEFLYRCKEKGIKLGIATSNSRELVENICRVHHLEDVFSCIMTGSEVINGKPAPDIYLAVAEGLRVDPGDCLIFEDIMPGLIAGRAAGMTICGVEDNYSSDTRIEKIEFADYYIEDYYDFF